MNAKVSFYAYRGRSSDAANAIYSKLIAYKIDRKHILTPDGDGVLVEDVEIIADPDMFYTVKAKGSMVSKDDPNMLSEQGGVI